MQGKAHTHTFPCWPHRSLGDARGTDRQMSAFVPDASTLRNGLAVVRIKGRSGRLTLSDHAVAPPDLTTNTGLKHQGSQYGLSSQGIAASLCDMLVCGVEVASMCKQHEQLTIAHVQVLHQVNIPCLSNKARLDCQDATHDPVSR